MWKIPLFDIDFDNEEISAIKKVINSRWVSMGEVTRQFEKLFAKLVGTKYAVAVSSGTAALHLANLALGITEGDEVICPAITFVAGINSIVYTGAKPVFAEITSLNNFNISADDIEKKINKKTKAIQVMHYAGFPCDMDKIGSIARGKKLKIIEDCAHALGTKYKGRMCGSLGDVGCFSFFANKNLTTVEGGMISTNDGLLAKKLRLMRSHGMTSLTLDRYLGRAFSYDVAEAGFNYRIDDLRSAIGIVQLKKLNKNNLKREKLVNLYRRNLYNNSCIELVFDNYKDASYHIFPVLLKEGYDRNKFMEFMKDGGIQTSIHYPIPYLFSYYKKKFGYKPGYLAFSEEVAKREVTLPLYPSMNFSSIASICQRANKFLTKTKGDKLYEYSWSRGSL